MLTCLRLTVADAEEMSAGILGGLEALTRKHLEKGNKRRLQELELGRSEQLPLVAWIWIACLNTCSCKSMFPHDELEFSSYLRRFLTGLADMACMTD